MNFIIQGKMPSKKNNYLIGGKRLYLAPFVASFIEKATWEINSQMKLQEGKMFIEPVFLSVTFYCDNRSDTDGMLATVFDILQKAGVVKNDRLIQGVTAWKHKPVLGKSVTLIDIIKVG